MYSLTHSVMMSCHKYSNHSWTPTPTQISFPSSTKLRVVILKWEPLRLQMSRAAREETLGQCGPSEPAARDRDGQPRLLEDVFSFQQKHNARRFHWLVCLPLFKVFKKKKINRLSFWLQLKCAAFPSDTSRRLPSLRRGVKWKQTTPAVLDRHYSNLSRRRNRA